MKVSELTIEELRDLIYEAIETKLKETLGDPDWNLELREDVKERLQHSMEAVEGGGTGISMDDVAARIGLEN